MIRTKGRALTVIAAAAAAVMLSTGVAEARPGAAYIRYGSSGYGVQCVQAMINAWFRANGDTYQIAEDGIDGSATTQRIADFQNAYNNSGLTPTIGVDGVVGPDTGQALFYAVSVEESISWPLDGLNDRNCWYNVPTHY